VDKKQKPVKRRRWIKRILLSLVILIVVLVFGVAPYLFAMLLTSRGTRTPDRQLTSTPADYGVEFRDVEYETTDGITIKGWLLPSRSRKVTIVYAHGLFRSRRELLERAASLWRRGYGGLLYDQRNHGDSEKSATSMGYFERLDALAGVRFLRETLEPGERIVMMGLSMGATACLHAAAETSDVSAVVSDSAFFSFDETISHHVRLFFKLPPFPIANEIGFFIEVRAGFDGAKLNSLEAVRKIDRPILFIAGANDRRIPPDVARRLYEASTNPKSDILIVDGPGTEIHGHAYPAAPELYLERVMKFIDAGISPQA
jgi:pimeloyl-ACP methyl ester carboxylesterase